MAGVFSYTTKHQTNKQAAIITACLLFVINLLDLLHSMFYSSDTNLCQTHQYMLNHEKESVCVTVQILGLFPVPQAKVSCVSVTRSGQ